MSGIEINGSENRIGKVDWHIRLAAPPNNLTISPQAKIYNDNKVNCLGGMGTAFIGQLTYM